MTRISCVFLVVRALGYARDNLDRSLVVDKDRAINYAVEARIVFRSAYRLQISWPEHGRPVAVPPCLRISLRAIAALIHLAPQSALDDSLQRTSTRRHRAFSSLRWLCSRNWQIFVSLILWYAVHALALFVRTH